MRRVKRYVISYWITACIPNKVTVLAKDRETAILHVISKYGVSRDDIVTPSARLEQL